MHSPCSIPQQTRTDEPTEPMGTGAGARQTFHPTVAGWTVGGAAGGAGRRRPPHLQEADQDQYNGLVRDSGEACSPCAGLFSGHDSEIGDEASDGSVGWGRRSRRLVQRMSSFQRLWFARACSTAMRSDE